MKKANITVTFDADKLSAAQMYMEQKDLSFEDEMEKAAESLYSKYVPAGVREFIEMSAGAKPAAKPRKAKTSSAVGEAYAPDGGDTD